MNDQKFKVGDRVRIVEEYAPNYPFRKSYDHSGMTGVLKSISENTKYPYCVCLHSGTPVSYDVNVHKIEHVKPEKQPVIVITSDGKTTTATVRQGKKVLKTATATCGRNDNFVFGEGARIAFDRLLGRNPFPAEEPKLFTGKMVCVKSALSRWWTVGKVYEVKDGKVADNQGTPVTGIHSVDEVNCKLLGAFRFIPLVED